MARAKKKQAKIVSVKGKSKTESFAFGELQRRTVHRFPKTKENAADDFLALARKAEEALCMDPKEHGQLYISLRREIERWTKIVRLRIENCPTLPELPELIRNDYFAAIVRLKEHCEAAAKCLDRPLVVLANTASYDPDTYMPVKECREQMDPPCGCPAWTKIKNANPWIRFEPNTPTNRPRIHRADAARLIKGKLNPDTFELLDVEGNGLPSLKELTNEYLADAAAMTAKIKEEKKHKQSV